MAVSVQRRKCAWQPQFEGGLVLSECKGTGIFDVRGTRGAAACAERMWCSDRQSLGTCPWDQQEEKACNRFDFYLAVNRFDSFFYLAVNRFDFYQAVNRFDSLLFRGQPLRFLSSGQPLRFVVLSGRPLRYCCCSGPPKFRMGLFLKNVEWVCSRVEQDF